MFLSFSALLQIKTILIKSEYNVFILPNSCRQKLHLWDRESAWISSLLVYFQSQQAMKYVSVFTSVRVRSQGRGTGRGAQDVAGILPSRSRLLH